ncbi:response regulator transcription factor [Nitratiruptor tergarcus]|uniref:DNA-binding response regulator, OmpR family, contains REC and winged-helix (WHTH) domain n=1 Tax=Nitratiruptor tergarcus DSM 16512 TaxID=1069081 RepID=A0A1W1WUK3_9BACT|nr:response regulator transcription factor [Nitratiruptor tergarcus]SMC09998.1 DNA-binding response regulator, OmpR family, contains REC and winged-helix (wHTH) domain [Nitratiruptor tergarcus DSM 16512]
MQKAKLLLLEDDLNLSETIAEYLEDEGFEVEQTFTSDEALEKVYEHNYDLLLLDVMVPGIDGFTLLKKLRQKSDAPAIFITSLDSVENLEKGYESGCDDYIRKPFALKELKLRIETLLKRSFDTKEEKIPIDEKSYFDIKSNQLFVNETPVNLNQKEIKLLKLFLKHPNEQISHEKIYETLWEYDETPSDMALRTYIKNLRKYLGKEKIESIKRYGYKFNK